MSPPSQPRPHQDHLAWDLAYVEAGIQILPVKPDKSPYTEHGFKDASTDLDQIREWWTRWPDAGIGIRTGSSSGFVGTRCRREGRQGRPCGT